MYISEAVRRARSYCPSEYELEEMYRWCDEVSSMLAVEDRNVFVRETLTPSKDDNFVLPENVTFENLYSVIYNGKVYGKKDLRTFDFGMKINAPIDIVYLKPYVPIRQITYRGEIQINNTECKIFLTENIFKTGDEIIITSDAVSADGRVIGTDIKNDVYVLELLSENITDFPEVCEAEIKRIITDRTVCDAPYDSMYTDYIIAKICMYQRDFETYNQFITSFNSRLEAYKKWLVNHLPQNEYRLKNWW